MNSKALDTISQIDTAFVVIFGVSAVILLGITACTLYFLYKYHHKRSPEAADIKGNVWAELLWTLIPSVLVLGLFWFGWASFRTLREAPESSMNISVEARMWSWTFIYENGKRSPDLYVPKGQPVKLNMTSVDVIHSFYAPAFRIKMDTVPGLNTYVWFVSDETGTFDVLCAEYCGLKHASMLARIYVVPEEEFETWLNSDTQVADDPKALLENYGCTSCHSLDGQPGVGPTLKNIHNTSVTVTMDGGQKKTLLRSRQYLKSSILTPGAAIVEGYDDIMPAQELPDKELKSILDFMVAPDN